MASVSNPFAMFICLYIQLSLCVLGTALSARPSLWGEKVVFNGRCLWHLDPQVAVPALEELTVCVLLRRNLTTAWTGFVYKGPGESRIELGLHGNHKNVVAVLFGEQLSVKLELERFVWHTLCLTWSGQRRRLKLYVNGTGYAEPLNATSPLWLAQNGTLTLGMSHNVESGQLKPEDGASLVGEIGRFRMWAREWSAEELNAHSCADGDVVRWDYQHWDHSGSCRIRRDNTLRCEWPLYKIRMRASIAQHHRKPVTPIISLETIIRSWLEGVFSHNISTHDVSVSSESHTCWEGNNTVVMQAQESRELKNSTFKLCFSSEVYVIVNPETLVEEVQAYISEQLSPAFSNALYTLEAVPQSLSVQPVEAIPAVKIPQPTSGSNISVTTHGTPSGPTHSSATEDPLNDLSVTPDKFFRVNVTVGMTGTPQNPRDIIRKWLNETLEKNGTMAVLNLKITPTISRYKCIFHVQADNTPAVEETVDRITDALASKYEMNGIALIETIELTIKHIVPGNCPSDPIETIYGHYEWPESFPQQDQRMGCVRPRSKKAYRLCKLHMDTETTRWAKPDMRACNPIKTISDLDDIRVTADNVDEVVDMIQDLINEELGAGEGDLSASQLQAVVGKLDQVVATGPVTSTLGTDIVHIVGDILASKTDVAPFANSILNLTEKLGDMMEFSEESANVSVPLLAVSMINVNPEEFRGLTFGVTSVSPEPEIFLNDSFLSQPFPETVTTISLPPVLKDFLQPGVGNRARVQFQFYGRQDLFNDAEISKTRENNWTLNSCIVSASINNSRVTNLNKGQHVVVTFSHRRPAQNKQKVQCVFWDFLKHGSQGGWNSSGCSMEHTSAYETSCHCNHLTHFGVLLDVSDEPLSDKDEQILTVISYVGCGMSSIFLAITLLTYIAFEKLRRDYPSQILINLSFALLGLNMVFLLDSWLASFPSYGLCIFTAATLHYFLLASFTWMGVEAVHMYFALVKVFNVYVPFYMRKLCALGWGIPLVIVILVIIIDKDVYGQALPRHNSSEVLHLHTFQSSEQFCWLQNDDAFFYVTVVAYVLLVLLCNVSVFVVVLVQIRRMKANNPAGKSRGFLHHLRSVAGLTVLLGLTWPLALFAQGPATVRVTMLYMFSILNSLQGFFIFVFHCLMKENVRKQWRIHLCCGQFRLTDYSGWSQSLSQGGRSKHNQLVHSMDSNNSSTTRKISNLSTDSAPGHCRND